jgi:hypothetical protein
MASKLKNYVRLDAKHQFVIGSNIKRRSKPVSGKWAQIFSPNCCGNPLQYTPVDVTSTTFVFEIFCDDITLFSVLVSTSPATTTIAELVDLLNSDLSGIGTFSVVDTTIIQFDPKAGVLEAGCPGNTLSFTVDAD